jgi:hypothetical protein
MGVAKEHSGYMCVYAFCVCVCIFMRYEGICPVLSGLDVYVLQIPKAEVTYLRCRFFCPPLGRLRGSSSWADANVSGDQR